MKTASNPLVAFAKLDRNGTQYLSLYAVKISGRPSGFIWKRRGFSYRGMQGWNRGIRIKDFHPIEWRCGLNDPRSSIDRGYVTYSRRMAAEELIRRSFEAKPCS